MPGWLENVDVVIWKKILRQTATRVVRKIGERVDETGVSRRASVRLTVSVRVVLNFHAISYSVYTAGALRSAGTINTTTPRLVTFVGWELRWKLSDK